MEDAMALKPSSSTGSYSPDVDATPVKPALKLANKPRKAKGGLKWDEAKIEEHDKLRGTRMKIEEPNTPYHHYDSGSETDGSNTGYKDKELSWDHLQNKLEGVAAARDAYPSSPSSHGGDDANAAATEDDDDDTGGGGGGEDHREKEMKNIQFREHRKRHYNEMELVRKFRQEHPDGPMADLADDDVDNDADDET